MIYGLRIRALGLLGEVFGRLATATRQREIRAMDEAIEARHPDLEDAVERVKEHSVVVMAAALKVEGS